MDQQAQNKGLAEAIEIVAGAEKLTALTGAGISVESGIPAFRGAQGLWDRFDPMEYAHLEAFKANPKKVWGMLKELDQIIARAKPNPGHVALAELERMGRLETIITQNVDNLHQAAGSKRVIEFHGNGSSLECLCCARIFNRQEVDLSDLPPRCGCGGVLKPQVIFIGEIIPEHTLAEAISAVAECQAMLVIGTSAVMAPASLMPALAARSGAKVIEVNVSSTELTGGVADITLLGPAGQILPALVKGVGQALTSQN